MAESGVDCRPLTLHNGMIHHCIVFWRGIHAFDSTDDVYTKHNFI